MGEFNLRQKPTIHFQILLWLCILVALLVISFVIQPEPVNAAVTKTMKACHICETAFPEITPTRDSGLCDIECVDPNQTVEVPKEILVQDTLTNQKDVFSIQYYWMDGCPGCEEILTTTISTLEQKYGSLIAIQKIELRTLEDVDQLYIIGAGFNLPKEQIGVPFVVAGELALSGVDQIQDKLPGIVSNKLNNDVMILKTTESPTPDATKQIPLISSSTSKTINFYWIWITLILVLVGLFLLTRFYPRLTNNRKE